MNLSTAIIGKHASDDIVSGSYNWEPPSVSNGSWLEPDLRPQSGLGTTQEPDPLCLVVFVTWTGHRTVGCWLGSNQTPVRTIWFLNLWHNISIWVLIVSWLDQYVDCSDWAARSPPAFEFGIRLIPVEWLWHKGRLQLKFAGFWSRLNEYLLYRQSQIGRWNSN
jgi:hypothetical protein